MKRSILMLEHDDDDRYITELTFKEKDYNIKLHFVHNSDDLFAFLISCERNLLAYPSLILLNNNALPSGAVDILGSLRSDPRYVRIPVVVLTGSTDAGLVKRCYTAGANSVIKKPDSTRGIDQKISTFVNYWFETVELP